MLKQKLSIIVLLCCLCCATMTAQSIKKLLKQGEDAMKMKDYSSAAQIYNQVILLDSSRIEYQVLFADASRLNYDEGTALHWYQKIYKKDNGKIYKEVPFYMATHLKTAGRYKEAKKLFDKYYKKQRNSNPNYKVERKHTQDDNLYFLARFL